MPEKTDQGSEIPKPSSSENGVSEVINAIHDLPEDKQKIILTSFTRTLSVHKGPLPSSDEIAKYEQVLTGAADRIIAMAEKQQAHRMQLEDKAVSIQLRQSGRGQWFAFIIALTFLAASVILVLKGYELAGTILGTVDLVALVTIFITGRRAQRKNLDEKKP